MEASDFSSDGGAALLLVPDAVVGNLIPDIIDVIDSVKITGASPGTETSEVKQAGMGQFILIWFLGNLAWDGVKAVYTAQSDYESKRWSGDFDGDGIPNFKDPDDDNDGVPDEKDNYPFDKDRSIIGACEPPNVCYSLAGLTGLSEDVATGYENLWSEVFERYMDTINYKSGKSTDMKIKSIGDYKGNPVIIGKPVSPKY